MQQRKVHSIQVDVAGHERVELVATHYGLTQAGAAALVLRAATDEQIKAEVKKLADHQLADHQGNTMRPVTRTTEVQGRPAQG